VGAGRKTIWKETAEPGQANFIAADALLQFLRDFGEVALRVAFGPAEPFFPGLCYIHRADEQRGWLTKEERRRAGKVWVYHYYRTRETDGHRVENTVVGSLSSLPREKDAWAEVEHRGLDRNHELGFSGRVMFGDLAGHYIKYELVSCPRHK
jgi:hypothetical protein